MQIEWQYILQSIRFAKIRRRKFACEKNTNEKSYDNFSNFFKNGFLKKIHPRKTWSSATLEMFDCFSKKALAFLRHNILQI